MSPYSMGDVGPAPIGRAGNLIYLWHSLMTALEELIKKSIHVLYTGEPPLHKCQ